MRDPRNGREKGIAVEAARGAKIFVAVFVCPQKALTKALSAQRKNRESAGPLSAIPFVIFVPL